MSPGSALDTGPARIVVCDDHAMFLWALVECLETVGHHVAAATADADELSTLVQTHRPALVLLDVSMPGRGGIDLARTVRESLPGAAIVLLTGSSDPSVRTVYDARLVDGLVSKGCGLRALDGALRRVLAGERVLVGWTVEVERPRRTALDLLTDRERQVLTLMTDGVSTTTMAETLGVSVNTVRTHVGNVLQKLGVHDRAKAAQAARELGLAAAG